MRLCQAGVKYYVILLLNMKYYSINWFLMA